MSVLRKARRVTTTLARVSRRIEAICDGSRRGLIGATIPAVIPPVRTCTVSIVFGRTNATTSVGPTPSERNRFAALLVSRRSWSQVCVRPLSFGSEVSW